MSWRTGCQSIGSFPTGRRCLFVISVSGLRRDPTPPARMTPLTLHLTQIFLSEFHYSILKCGVSSVSTSGAYQISTTQAGYSWEHRLDVKVVIPAARLVVQEPGTKRKERIDV